MPTLSNEEWLDYFFDNIWCDEDNTWYLDEKGKTLSKDLLAKQAILAKLESLEQEAYKKGFVEGSLSKLPVLQVNSKSHNYSEGKG